MPQNSFLYRRIMDSHPCTEALAKGCDSLGLPKSAAKELLRFFLVKKFASEEKKRDYAPSPKLLQLWKWLLLETDLRDEGAFQRCPLHPCISYRHPGGGMNLLM